MGLIIVFYFTDRLIVDLNFIYLKNTLMKNLHFLLIALAMFALSGCSAIAGIFKAGAVVGVIAVIVVIAVILWLVSLFRGKN
jgi:hypothetical protein